jgi:hypothetical protein
MVLDGMVQSGSTCLRRMAEGDEATEIRFGRFLRNERVTVERIVAGGSEATARAVAGRHALLFQDTSEFNFRTSEGHRRGLGPIGKGVGRGALLHAMIAADAEHGDVLGLAGAQIWTRPEPVAGAPKKKKSKKKRRPAGEKEWRRWVETPQAAKPVLAAAAMVTVVSDSEGDGYRLWAEVPDSRTHVLGRAYHDRKLAGGGTLKTAARQWKVLGTRELTIREREDRPEREAKLELRAGTVTILRPQECRDPLPEQLTLTLIDPSLRGGHPPAGAEPVSWHLLTTHSPADADAAWRIVDWYRRRWTIEQFFRTLKKQGLQVEDSQLETAERLLKLLAIAARAAVVIMQLTQARDGNSGLAAALVFSPAEIATLQAVDASSYSAPGRPRPNPHPPLSLPWASWIVARLGGWGGRPKARPPGPITFKHGLDTLQRMAAGWALRDKYTP